MSQDQASWRWGASQEEKSKMHNLPGITMTNMCWKRGTDKTGWQIKKEWQMIKT